MLPVFPDYPDSQQLTTFEAGQIAGRDRRTIVSWIKADQLKAFKLPGARGQYRILWGELKKVLENEYVPAGKA